MLNSLDPLSLQIMIGVVALVLGLTIGVGVYLLLRAVRFSKSRGVRIFAATSAAVVVLISPLLFDAVISGINHTEGLARVYVDPSWALKVAPGIVGLIVAMFLLKSRGRRVTSQ